MQLPLLIKMYGSSMQQQDRMLRKRLKLKQER